MKRSGPVVLALALTFVLIGVVGCGKDNEEAAQITGVAPTTEGGGPVNYEDYAKKQQQATQTNYKAQGYPGAN